MPEFVTVNPARRKPARRSKSKSSLRAGTGRGRKNPGPGILLTMANKAKKRRHNVSAGKRRRRNPAVKTIVRYKNRAKARKARRNPAHRRNPFHIAGYGVKQIGTLAGGAFVGALATRSLTSKILGPGHNEGLQGYVANALVALGLGWAGARFVNPLFGGGILAGGGGTIVQRFWDEKVAKLVPVAAMAISGGASAGHGMGDISYDGAATLEGYYNSAFTPRNELLDPIGMPALGAGGPVAVGRSLHMAAMA